MSSARHDGRGLHLPPTVVETVSGLTAGLLSTLCVHPLDLVKTRLQIDRSPTPPKLGTSLRIARDVAVKEGDGWRALYRGLTPNVVGNMVSWGLYFMLYGDLKSRLTSIRPDARLSSTDYLLSSASAGVLTAIATNPLWVIKTRMLATAASTPGAYPSMLSGLTSILKEEGPRGLMRGLVPALFGVTHGALQFMFYEELKIWRRSRMAAMTNPENTELGNLDFLVLSGTSKILAGVITYPYRVVQTRAQMHGVYNGPWDVVKRSWRAEGVMGFYKGLAPNILRVLPSTCITFLVYENARFYLS